MKDLIQKAIDVLESGSSEGCSGDLIVADRVAYQSLRNAVHNLTGVWYGEDDPEEDE